MDCEIGFRLWICTRQAFESVHNCYIIRLASLGHHPRDHPFRRRQKPMPNMKQIARMANVALGTISHVLNDSARVREPLLRRRVMEAVEALGYQPSQLARVSAATRRT
jgi:hypothetical protein